jgi:hypothetical protein
MRRNEERLTREWARPDYQHLPRPNRYGWVSIVTTIEIVASIVVTCLSLARHVPDEVDGRAIRVERGDRDRADPPSTSKSRVRPHAASTEIGPTNATITLVAPGPSAPRCGRAAGMMSS